MKEMTLSEAIAWLEGTCPYDKNEFDLSVDKLLSLAKSIPQIPGYEFMGIRQGEVGEYVPISNTTLNKIRIETKAPFMIYRKLAPEFAEHDVVVDSVGFIGVVNLATETVWNPQHDETKRLAKMSIVQKVTPEILAMINPGPRYIFERLAELADLKREQCKASE